jgi:hypothetical protein
MLLTVLIIPTSSKKKGDLGLTDTCQVKSLMIRDYKRLLYLFELKSNNLTEAFFVCPST